MRLTVATDGGWLREFRADGAGLTATSVGGRRCGWRRPGWPVWRTAWRVSRDVAEIAARHLAPPARPE